MQLTKDNSYIRNVYIIDPYGKIRTILIYPKEIGRNINEILRILIALQTSDTHNVLTPANWEEKTPTIAKPPTTYEDLKERLINSSSYNCFDWYLCFNKNIIGGIKNE